MNIFIVDDEAEVLEMLCDLVRGLGISFSAYSDADSAIKDLDAKKPCLILSDFKMPGLNGLEFCAEVKSKLPNTRFLLITGHADKKIAISALNIGVAEIIEKPFDLQSLGKTVAKHAAKYKTSENNSTVSGDDEGVWVENSKLDSFMQLSGELIVLKNYFDLLAQDHDTNGSQRKRISEFSLGLNKITDSLQEQIMSVRKVSLERIFSKVPQMVGQTALDLGKQVKLEMSGLELGIDKNIANSLGASIVHLVRNGIDHAIEVPAERIKRGKNREGLLSIVASESEGVIRIAVKDDGAGIDRERVLAKAVEQGLVEKGVAHSLTEAQAFDLLFTPGFSTKETISNVSGRGIGMDVVKSIVLSHNGKVRVESTLGVGTIFHLEIPVPKSVMVERTILVRSDETIFAVPLKAISRILPCKDLVISEVSQQKFFQFERKTVRFCRYRELVTGRQIQGADASVGSKSVIVLCHKDSYFGFVIDSIEGQLEAVIRPFDSIVKTLPGLVGTTVLSDETVAYIVSPEELLKVAA